MTNSLLVADATGPIGYNSQTRIAKEGLLII